MNELILIGQHELPTTMGTFQLFCFKLRKEGHRVFALTSAEPGDQIGTKVRLRIQYACLYGTTLNAIDCDCGFQLHCAMQIAANDRSVLVLYFYDHEAQGLGLEAKVQYTEREKAAGASFAQLLKQDKVDVLPDVLWTVVPILSKLRLGKRISLMTNSMEKTKQLIAHGADVVDVEKNWDAPCIKKEGPLP